MMYYTHRVLEEFNKLLPTIQWTKKSLLHASKRFIATVII